MICARAGCGKELRPDQIRDGIRYHSYQCAAIERGDRRRIASAPPVLVLVRVPDSEYEMTCLRCEQKYDGRTGPWIGLCSVLCVGAWAMGEVAGHVPLGVVAG